MFECALAITDEGLPQRWHIIAEQVPGKSALEVLEHYEALVHDVNEIDSGRVEVPDYDDDFAETTTSSLGWHAADQIAFGSKLTNNGTERKKGIPWSKEEHRRFLRGLKKFGKGDWRSISRKAVITKTPTQVASHAQKYFLRQNAGKKERKRSSIHDMISVDTNPVPMPVDTNYQMMAPVTVLAPLPLPVAQQNWVPPQAAQMYQPAELLQPTQQPHHSGPYGYPNYKSSQI